MDDKLGAGYSEAEIRAVLAGEKQHTPRKKSVVQPEPPKVNLLVDIQAKLQAGKGAGYARWAKVFNLKQMAQTLSLIHICVQGQCRNRSGLRYYFLAKAGPPA